MLVSIHIMSRVMSNDSSLAFAAMFVDDILSKGWWNFIFIPQTQVNNQYLWKRPDNPGRKSSTISHRDIGVGGVGVRGDIATNSFSVTRISLFKFLTLKFPLRMLLTVASVKFGLRISTTRCASDVPEEENFLKILDTWDSSKEHFGAYTFFLKITKRGAVFFVLSSFLFVYI